MQISKGQERTIYYEVKNNYLLNSTCVFKQK